MSFWVAKNRQKAPENAFMKRARLKAEADEKRAAERAAASVSESESTPEVAPEPDFEALRKAALNMVEELRPNTEGMKGVEVTASTIDEDKTLPTAPASTRGRKKSEATAKRDAAVLETVQAAGPEGISKPDIAVKVEEKEQQVYTSLQLLRNEGKVKSEYIDGLGYRWIAL